MLGIANSLIEAVSLGLKNPLSSDLSLSLALETGNYNDLFNVLPTSVADIVYVEEMTPEEWALYAAKKAQQLIVCVLS